MKNFKKSLEIKGFERQEEFLKELSKLITLRRHYYITEEDLITIVCMSERLKLKINKFSYNIQRGKRWNFGEINQASG